jgi:hypothetical protein
VGELQPSSPAVGQDQSELCTAWEGTSRSAPGSPRSRTGRDPVSWTG